LRKTSYGLPSLDQLSCSGWMHRHERFPILVLDRNEQGSVTRPISVTFRLRAIPRRGLGRHRGRGLVEHLRHMLPCHWQAAQLPSNGVFRHLGPPMLPFNSFVSRWHSLLLTSPYSQVWVVDRFPP